MRKYQTPDGEVILEISGKVVTIFTGLTGRVVITKRQLLEIYQLMVNEMVQEEKCRIETQSLNSVSTDSPLEIASESHGSYYAANRSLSESTAKPSSEENSSTELNSNG